jgi:hypothetical protein
MNDVEILFFKTPSHEEEVCSVCNMFIAREMLSCEGNKCSCKTLRRGRHFRIAAGAFENAGSANKVELYGRKQ